MAEHPAEFLKKLNAHHPGVRVVDLQAWGQEQTAAHNREWGMIVGAQMRVLEPAF